MVFYIIKTPTVNVFFFFYVGNIKNDLTEKLKLNDLRNEQM